MKKSEKALRIVAAIDRLIEEGFALSATEGRDCNCGLSGCGFYEPTWRTEGFYQELAKLNDARNKLHLRTRAEWIIDEDEDEE